MGGEQAHMASPSEETYGTIRMSIQTTEHLSELSVKDE